MTRVVFGGDSQELRVVWMNRKASEMPKSKAKQISERNWAILADLGGTLRTADLANRNWDLLRN
jgi:hypothetical protein